MDNASPSKPSRLLRVVLILSLGFNLVIVGLVAGAAVSGRFSDNPPRSFDLSLGPFVRTLDQDSRREIGKEIRRSGGTQRFDMRGHMQEILVALQAEPFDADAFGALMERQNDHVAGVQSRARTALLSHLSQMTSAERADFADRLQEQMARPRSGRGPDRSGG